MADILLRGGRVIDPARNFDASADVLLQGGKVARVEPGIAASAGAREGTRGRGRYAAAQRGPCGRPGRSCQRLRERYQPAVGGDGTARPGGEWAEVRSSGGATTIGVIRSSSRAIVSPSCLPSGMVICAGSRRAERPAGRR